MCCKIIFEFAFDSRSSQSEVQFPALTRRDDGSTKSKSIGKKNSSKSESDTSVLNPSQPEPYNNLVDDILNEPHPSLVHTHRDTKAVHVIVLTSLRLL